MQAAALAKRDQLFHHRTQVLRLRQRGNDLLVLDQRSGEIRQHGTAMIRAPVELAVGFGVTHFRYQCSVISNQIDFCLLTTDYRLLFSNDPQSAWPAPRYSPAASPALPCRDAVPSAPALP